MAVTHAKKASRGACNNTQARGSTRRCTIAAKEHVVAVARPRRAIVIMPTKNAAQLMSALRSAENGDGGLKQPMPHSLYILGLKTAVRSQLTSAS